MQIDSVTTLNNAQTLFNVYDQQSETLLNMSDVLVGDCHFIVEMVHQGDWKFKVNSYALLNQGNTNNDNIYTEGDFSFGYALIGIYFCNTLKF